MEVKKSPKADLEGKRNIFVQLGLVISLGIILLAFEWTTKVTKVSAFDEMEAFEVEEEIIPITREEQVVETTPPPAPTVVEVLNIVDDDTEIEEELEIESDEADEETVIEIAPIIEQEEEEEAENTVFVIVEDMPMFPGGDIALRSYLGKNVKYPVVAQENGIQGKVYVSFVVDRDGSVINARIARGVDSSLDKEALRVVNSLPKWKPGMQGGKAVKVSYTVPINFKLQ